MPTKVYLDEAVVVPLLTKIRLPRWIMIDLSSQIAGERANVTDDDPPTATGYETWRWGTRFCREDKTLKGLGWVPCEKDQISGIKNDALKLKLVICNTDSNTGNPFKAPKNLSEKGPASCKLIGKNSSQIDMGFPHDDDAGYDLWYYCSFYCERYISIEVSRPSGETAGVVSSFSDRIIIAKPGELPGIRRHVVPQEFADVPRPTVTRKTG